MKTIAALALSLLALTGCSQQQIDKVQNTIATDAPKLADDGLVYAQIEAKLVQIDPNSALHVALAVHNGSVRLSGHVKSDDTEKRYTQAAAHVSGVTHVNATMTVDPNLRSASKDVDDFALATAVRAHLTAQAGVNGITLGVGSKNGVVTLDGTVPTAALHQTIVATARTTAGVKSVVDRLHTGS
jgi:osmotically-inducible protein OsmY